MIDRWEQFNLIIDDESLDVKEKGLLLILFRYVNYKTGYADPSRELLKKLYGTKKNDVLDKVLSSLVKKGYLIRESGKGIRSKYYLKVGTQIEPSPIKEPSPKKGSTVGTQIEPTVGTQIEPQKEKKRKRKENIYMNLKFIDDVIDKVKITEDQYKNLKNKFGIDLLHRQIISLDNYIANGKGAKYKDHYRVLNTWCNKDKPKETKKEYISPVYDDFKFD